MHAKNYKHNATDARRRVCAAMVPYRLATRGTSLRELEYTHTKHKYFLFWPYSFSERVIKGCSWYHVSNAGLAYGLLFSVHKLDLAKKHRQKGECQFTECEKIDNINLEKAVCYSDYLHTGNKALVNSESTLIQRRGIKSKFMQCWFNVLCLLDCCHAIHHDVTFVVCH